MWVGDQWPDACPGADDVSFGKVCLREKTICDFEDVTNVRSFGENLVQRAVVVGVRGAEDGSFAPGDGEEDSFAFGHDDCVRHRNARAIHDQMHAFGEAEFYATVRQAVCPGAGGIDDCFGVDGHVFAGQGVGYVALPGFVLSSRVKKSAIVQRGSLHDGRRSGEYPARGGRRWSGRRNNGPRRLDLPCSGRGLVEVFRSD